MDVVRSRDDDGAPHRAAAEDAAWLYAHNGARIGPVGVDMIRLLVANGTINEQTMVWRFGIGDWLPIHRTELASLVASASAPVTPPPLTGGAVSNGLVWIVAFVPLIGLLAFVESMIQPAYGNLSGVLGPNPWNFIWLFQIGLCLADVANLIRAGHDTKGMAVWALLLVPGYLFVRAARLKQGKGYAIVWLVTHFVSLLIPLVVVIAAMGMAKG
jgi:hypothetical protein